MTWQLPIDLINNPNNPLSFDPPDDFNLQENSPCIDAGNPADEYFDPDDTVADMGLLG